jgi:hypothetical protein
MGLSCGSSEWMGLFQVRTTNFWVAPYIQSVGLLNIAFPSSSSCESLQACHPLHLVPAISCHAKSQSCTPISIMIPRTLILPLRRSLYTPLSAIYNTSSRPIATQSRLSRPTISSSLASQLSWSSRLTQWQTLTRGMKVRLEHCGLVRRLLTILYRFAVQSRSSVMDARRSRGRRDTCTSSAARTQSTNRGEFRVSRL